MKKSVVFGIDPGLKGGVAFKIGKVGHAFKMPLVGGEIHVGQIRETLLQFDLDEVIVIIEKVHSMPGQGVASVFSFGMGYGKLLGLCQTLDVAHELVTPQSWKKVVLRDTQKDKAAATDFCKRHYPNISLVPAGGKKDSDGLADAICLMHWGILNYG